MHQKKRRKNHAISFRSLSERYLNCKSY
uniref:Uncharacterized protein n=1 Tax=Arundo donax TaxID=35708 RepID=A0A0A9H1L5_ARUDO